MNKQEQDKLIAFAIDEGYEAASDFIKDFNRMREALRSMFAAINRIESATGVLGLD
jgi:hypothetical protein